MKEQSNSNKTIVGEDSLIMPTKQSQITYQSSASSKYLDRLIARFGDCLEELTAIDKLDLIAILGFWQSAKMARSEAGMPPISLSKFLAERMAVSQNLQSATTLDVDEALEILGDCSDDDALTLLVSLPCQLRDGVWCSA
jgi:hypothetical protein